MNRRLHRCPTCGRDLDDATRASMGLRNGEILNGLCPGWNGPSDIDHVLHNGHHRPEERLVFLEYKNGPPLNDGQRFLFNSLKGDWQERNSNRLLSVRYKVLPQHPKDLISLFAESAPEPRPSDVVAVGLLQPIVSWLWPDAQAREAS